MLILPAIDLLNGRCVRLAQGDFSRETNYGNAPGEVAKGFAEAGAIWVHVVDLDGARTGEPSNWPLLEDILASGLQIELGGGIRTIERAKAALALGVSRVVVGSKLVSDPEASSRFFGELGDQVVAGIDARDGQVAIHGWETASSLSAAELALRVQNDGCQRIILTDIARDGMQNGPNLELLGEVANALSIKVIQSGGVGSEVHVESLARSGIPNLEGVIIGRAIYEGSINLASVINSARAEWAGITT